MAFIEDSSRPKEPSTAKSSEILVMELVPEANGGATEPQNALSKRFSERQAVGLSERPKSEKRVGSGMSCCALVVVGSSKEMVQNQSSEPLEFIHLSLSFWRNQSPPHPDDRYML